MKAVLELILDEMESFLEKWTEYMSAAGYLEHTTAKRDDCILSIRGIVEPMIVMLKERDVLDFPDILSNHRHLADFTITTARRHMERGISAEMFFGCLKTLVHSVEDIILESDMTDTAKIDGLIQIRRALDAVESIAIQDWAGMNGDDRYEALAAKNRSLTMDKNKYENIFESTSDMVLVVDVDGRVLEANVSAHGFFPDIIGTDILVRLGLPDAGMDALIARTRSSTPVEHTLPDGFTVCTIAIVPLKRVSLASPGSVVILNDITCIADRRQQLEKLVSERTEALSTSEKLFRSLFSSAGEGIILVDESLTIVQANRKAADMFGIPAEKLSDKNCVRIFHPDSIDRLRHAANRDDGEVWEGEVNCVNDSGDTFPASITVNRFLLGDKRFLHLIVRNITQQKAMEEYLRQEKTKAEEMNVTLRNVLKTIDREKEELEHSVSQKVTTQIVPSLQKLVGEDSEDVRKMYFSIIRDQLAGIARSSGTINEKDMLRLTKSELQVCQMIQSGASSKDIAETMHISFETVQTHRKNIRRKLGLAGKDVNLFTYLNS